MQFGLTGRRVFRIATAVALLITMSACAREALLAPVNWAAPDIVASRQAGVAYGADPRQTLDVYVPATRQPAPVVIFWHGGSWQGGDKDYYRFVGAALAERGFLALVPNYRLAPEHPFPAFVQDAALAVKWAKEHAQLFGGDPDRLYLSGHSAGGHIALILALDGRHLAEVGLASGSVAGVIPIAAPTGIENLRGAGLKGVFPPTVPDSAFSPIDLAGTNAIGAPEILLLHGADDSVVRAGNAVRLADSLRNAGGAAEARIYPDTGHLGILLQFSDTFGSSGRVLDDIAAFAGLTRWGRSRRLRAGLVSSMSGTPRESWPRPIPARQISRGWRQVA